MFNVVILSDVASQSTARYVYVNAFSIVGPVCVWHTELRLLTYFHNFCFQHQTCCKHCHFIISLILYSVTYNHTYKTRNNVLFTLADLPATQSDRRIGQTSARQKILFGRRAHPFDNLTDSLNFCLVLSYYYYYYFFYWAAISACYALLYHQLCFIICHYVLFCMTLCCIWEINLIWFDYY